MPRITPSRVLKVISLPWVVLLGLWLFLPSPAIPTASRNHHIERVLTTGHKLTTVHEWHYSFAGAARNVYNSWSRMPGLIIDWRLSAEENSNSVALHIGRDLVVNLTSAVLQSVPEENGQFTPYLSPPFHVEVGSGDEQHIINMPWFRWSDRIIFNQKMYSSTWAMNLRVFVPAEGMVEIWKDAAHWDNFPNTELHDSDRESGVLASFSNVPTARSARSSITRIHVREVKGRLTSTTFALRNFILGPLEPVLFASLHMIMFLFPILMPLTPLVGVYFFMVLVVWLYKGRPAFREWSTIFWMTKWLPCIGRRRRQRRRARIWGPAGPVHDEYDELLHSTDYDEKRGMRGDASSLRESVAKMFVTRLFDVKSKPTVGGRFQIP